jgi:hypothetical protein
VWDVGMEGQEVGYGEVPEMQNRSTMLLRVSPPGLASLSWLFLAQKAFFAAKNTLGDNAISQANPCVCDKNTRWFFARGGSIQHHFLCACEKKKQKRLPSTLRYVWATLRE